MIMMFKCEMCEEDTNILYYNIQTRQNICKECYDIWNGNKKFDKIIATSKEMENLLNE